MHSGFLLISHIACFCWHNVFVYNQYEHNVLITKSNTALSTTLWFLSIKLIVVSVEGTNSEMNLICVSSNGAFDLWPHTAGIVSGKLDHRALC